MTKFSSLHWYLGFYLNKRSAGCCKPLVNFQTSEKVYFDNFCQCCHCCHGGRFSEAQRCHSHWRHSVRAVSRTVLNAPEYSTQNLCRVRKLQNVNFIFWSIHSLINHIIIYLCLPPLSQVNIYSLYLFLEVFIQWFLCLRYHDRLFSRHKMNKYKLFPMWPIKYAYN